MNKENCALKLVDEIILCNQFATRQRNKRSCILLKVKLTSYCEEHFIHLGLQHIFRRLERPFGFQFTFQEHWPKRMVPCTAHHLVIFVLVWY